MTNNFFRTNVPATPALDRLRSGNSQVVPALPSRATVRPGFLEKVMASPSQRTIMRQREDAAVTVESEQIDAAVAVATDQVRNTAELQLKTQAAETARIHNELEVQMQKDSRDADADRSNLVGHAAIETLEQEQTMLTEAQSRIESGRIPPDRAKLLGEIIHGVTDRSLENSLALNDMISDGRRERIGRTLSRNR